MNVPSEDQIAEMLSNPAVAASMNEALNNPNFIDFMIQQNPMLRDMPNAREMLQSPLFRQMMTNPEALRAAGRMRDMFGGPAPSGSAFPAPGAQIPHQLALPPRAPATPRLIPCRVPTRSACSAPCTVLPAPIGAKIAHPTTPTPRSWPGSGAVLPREWELRLLLPLRHLPTPATRRRRQPRPAEDKQLPTRTRRPHSPASEANAAAARAR